jgi:hypothetical protein
LEGLAHAVNGFSDVHAAFDGVESPRTRRLGNAWGPVSVDLGRLWLGSATSRESASPAVAHAPGWWLWASGDLFTYRSLRVDPLQGFANDLALGRAAPELLDSHALIIGWEEASGSLHVWTNRMGTVHAYAGGAPGHRSVGTSFAAVSEGSARSLDWEAITGFCGFGFYPGDRTMFTDVRILRPATWTVFNESGDVIESRSYWNWSYQPEQRADADLVDEFDDIWSRSLEVQLDDVVGVIPLSGGLDSRTVFATAAPARATNGGRVRALTYGYGSDSPEIRIARQVAAARGVRADEFVIGPYLFNELDAIGGAIEGFSTMSGARQASVRNPLAAMGERVVGGHWGDVWFDTAGGNAQGDLVDLALAKFTKSGSGWLLEHLCEPHLDKRPPGDVLRDFVREELVRLPDLGDRDMTLKVLKTEQWSFRWTLASVRAYQLALPVLLPFYANEVIDFFLRVPSQQHAGRRLQTSYLRRRHPDLAQITWQQTGMSLFERSWEPALGLLHRVVRKAERSVRRHRVLERNWEVQFLSGDAPQRLREHLLQPQTPLADIVDLKLVSQLIDEFLRVPNGANGYTVDALLTLDSSVGTRSDKRGNR